MEKLKPCPFCGGEAKIERIAEEQETLYYAMCICCCATNGAYHSKEKAAAAWNRRAEPETIVNNGTMTITM